MCFVYSTMNTELVLLSDKRVGWGEHAKTHLEWCNVLYASQQPISESSGLFPAHYTSYLTVFKACTDKMFM